MMLRIWCLAVSVRCLVPGWGRHGKIMDFCPNLDL